MAQEHAGAAGQEPVGYDYQQPWYPQQGGHQGDQWTEGQPPQQQPWPTQDQSPWQPGTPEGQYAQPGYEQPFPTGQPYPAEPQPYAADQLYAPDQSYAAQPYAGRPYAEQQGYPQADFGHAGTGTEQPYADPYQPDATAGTEQQLYAPPGADGYYAPYGTGEPATPGDPTAAFPAVASPAFPDAATSAFPAVATAGPTAPEADPASADPAAEGAGRPGLVERAKAMADSVISADHAPSRRALAIRAGAGAAALAVLITAGIIVTSGDDGGSKADSNDATAAAPGFAVAHTKTWAAQAAPAASAQPGAPAAAPADDSLLGGWLLSDAVVRADSTGVHAYALADGKPTWTVAPPAPGAVPCGLSPTVNAAGLGAALFRPQADPKSPCTAVVAVDTKTGKTAWQKNLSDAKENYAAHVAVTDAAVIAVGDDKAAAWAAGDGKDSWQYGGQGKYCTLSGSANGATVLLHSSCADSNPVDQAVALGAGDGKVKWWRGLNNQPKTVTVLSAEPAVVLTTGAQPADDRIFGWGAAGDPAVEIPLTTPAGRLDASRGAFDALPNVFFQGQTMVTTLTPTGTGPTTVTGYDLGTGKQTWKTPAAEKAKARAVGFDKGALLLAVDERLDQPAHLSRFAATGGQETAGGGYPQGTGSLLTAGRVLTAGGKFVVLPEHSANFGTVTAFQAKS
ncbi:hypothetical protein CFP65_5650 [Kitasatospora sp. MMS16-BH015]|uniref:outer membrane protein assembly factor BamB family protein n=1 Tax=Kitasatospora sp. MMS16-BH015 TaxID=2018025 RepID=UPI000CA17A6C|nr:PQQ-binding-like beta-propeller repeat protein [Kitasatospora sp. MMS16-BH015]AUG80345.1 hypothetical protein CFP65_5650 [Kitasatospora sp. MMS16-BH015]